MRLMKYGKYDYRDPAKAEHRLYAIPAGVRVGYIVKPDGVTASTYDDNGFADMDITGFAPVFETLLMKTWEIMRDRAIELGGLTLKESKCYASGIVVDGYLLDTQKGFNGSADKTLDALDEWLLDEFEITDEYTTQLRINAITSVKSATAGRDDKDQLFRRANLRTALGKTGANIRVVREGKQLIDVPGFIIELNDIVAADWGSKLGGVAWPKGELFEKQLDNCFDHGNVGALDFDTLRSWNIANSTFQRITEDATL